MRVIRENTKDFVGDRLCCFGPDFAAATRAKGVRDPRPEQFQIIIDLCHCAHGRARCFDRVRLLDRDRRGNTADVVNTRFVHAIEELSHVRAERLDVAALAFGVNGFERQTRFAAAARAGNNRQFAERKIDIDSLEIVLASTANFHAVRHSGRGNKFFFRSLRTHWKRSQMRGRCANFYSRSRCAECLAREPHTRARCP